MNTFATKSSSCFVNGTSNRRITREEMTTLKNVSVAQMPVAYKVAQVFHNCCNAIVTSLSAPVKKAAPVNSMCKFYGHIIEGAWQGAYPKCRDCGCDITSPDQLRKASAR